MAQAPALTAEQNRLGRARGVLAVTLVVLGALLAPVGAVTLWARQVATDTDTYVNLVAPLAQDPAEHVNPEGIRYVNRVSDLLFVAARAVNDNGNADVLWVPGKNR